MDEQHGLFNTKINELYDQLGPDSNTAAILRDNLDQIKTRVNITDETLNQHVADLPMRNLTYSEKKDMAIMACHNYPIPICGDEERMPYAQNIQFASVRQEPKSISLYEDFATAQTQL